MQEETQVDTDSMGLPQWLRKVADSADVEFVREGMQLPAKAFMKPEVS